MNRITVRESLHQVVDSQSLCSFVRNNDAARRSHRWSIWFPASTGLTNSVTADIYFRTHRSEWALWPDRQLDGSSTDDGNHLFPYRNDTP